MIKPPKGIEFRREFYPDMKRMVHALKVLLESKPSERKPDAADDLKPAAVKEESA